MKQLRAALIIIIVLILIILCVMFWYDLFFGTFIRSHCSGTGAAILVVVAITVQAGIGALIGSE